jgi:hypothetical protein
MMTEISTLNELQKDSQADPETNSVSGSWRLELWMLSEITKTFLGSWITSWRSLLTGFWTISTIQELNYGRPQLKDLLTDPVSVRCKTPMKG